MSSKVSAQRASVTRSLMLILSSISALTLASPTLLEHAVVDVPSIQQQQQQQEQQQQPQLQRRQNSGAYTAVTGIQGTGIQPRLEIRQLQNNTDQWNLYILALNSFMKSNESEKLSFYQIAGIHGRPYVPWDNVGPFVGNTEGPGYCTHVSNIFLPWHRPYLALYEQVLYSHMLDIVDLWSTNDTAHDRYMQAAAAWRHPYWDWATPPTNGGSVYPAVMSEKTISVQLPNGTTTIANPLFAFEFHPVSISDFYYNPFATWSETKRYPTNWSTSAVSQNNLVAAIMDNNRQSIQQRLYNLFTNYDNFTEFSNEAWYYGNTVSNADSIESIHDVIHAITGESGHMTYLDYSAFDPIFFLHHAMIDRVFALYQAVYPDAYVEPMKAIERTFTIAPKQDVDVNTSLDPFHSDSSGSKHTSTTVRNHTIFGYTYTELLNNSTAASVRSAINSLYGSSAGSSTISRRSTYGGAERGDAFVGVRTDTALSSLPGETTSEGKRKQYILNLQSDKFATNGSYAIYVFLGYFNEDEPSTWALAPNLVGTHGVFTALPNDDAATGLSKRMGASSVLVTGTIPLTGKLLESVASGELASMNDDDVEEFLSANLHWKAALFDNTEIPLASVTGFDVNVVRADVIPAVAHDAFPTWSGFVKLSHITSRTYACGA